MNILLNQENDRLRNVLLYSLLDDNIRESVGLKGVSQFFHAGQGWYFWPIKRSGVYEIEFLKREEKNNFISIVFALKYYPHPDETVFADYSVFEQMIRLQYPFEDNCPTPRCRETPAADLFYVGEVGLHWHDEAVFLSLHAQNRWEEYLKEGLKIENSKGEVQELVGAGEKDRNVPGWELSFDLYNCLMKAFCFIYKSEPQLLVLEKSPGEVFYVDKAERISKESGGDNEKIRLTAALSLRGDLLVQDEIFEEAKALPGLGKGEIIYQSGRSDFLKLYPQYFNRDWWRMACRGREILTEGLRI